MMNDQTNARIIEHRAYTNAELNADAQPLPFDEWLAAIERIERRGPSSE